MTFLIQKLLVTSLLVAAVYGLCHGVFWGWSWSVVDTVVLCGVLSVNLIVQFVIHAFLK